MQENKRCFFCGTEIGLEVHHVMSGTANRKLSEKYGLTVWLCHRHHTGVDGAQYDKEKNQALKQLAQIAFENRYGHDEWMKVFRKNYL